MHHKNIDISIPVKITIYRSQAETKVVQSPVFAGFNELVVSLVLKYEIVFFSEFFDFI